MDNIEKLVGFINRSASENNWGKLTSFSDGFIEKLGGGKIDDCSFDKILNETSLINFRLYKGCLRIIFVLDEKFVKTLFDGYKVDSETEILEAINRNIHLRGIFPKN